MAVFTGTIGNDSLTGTTGVDQMYGLQGDDTLLGAAGNDVLEGGAGADVLNGGIGTDTATYANSASGVTVNLTAGVGSGGDAQGDTLTAIETVIGSSFSDTLESSTAYHNLQGGAGNDVYIIGTSSVVVTEIAGNGTDEVRTAQNAFTLAAYANVENLTYTGTATFNANGNDGDNVIRGGVGDDLIHGGAGNDLLIGGSGNDKLAGGVGADTLQGGEGTDTANYQDSSAVMINLKTGNHTGSAEGDIYDSIEVIEGSNYDDTFAGNASGNSFKGGVGFDTIDYSSSTAAVNVNLTTNSASGGDAQDDTLAAFERVIGSSYNDTLASSTALHKLQGGQGNDIYVVGNASVAIVEGNGGGIDEVRTALATYTLPTYSYLENLTYTGTASFTGTGNEANNIITGGIGNDIFLGGAGADQFHGGTGTDTVSYSDSPAGPVSVNLRTGIHTGIAAGDTFDSIERFGGSNFADVFAGDANATYFNGVSGVDTIDYSMSESAVNVNLSTNVVSGGDAQGDTILSFEKVVGSAFNDTLASTTDLHTLQGGAGDDVYIVGFSSVAVIEAAGGGVDEVRTALTTFSLGSNVEKLTYTGTAAFTGTGNALDNVLSGSVGNDVFVGGAGADEFHGGAGIDTVSYADGAAVTLNFSTGNISGNGNGDTFYDIEKYSGSVYGDKFIESADLHQINGDRGVDLVSYELSTAGITFNLATLAHTGIAAGDILTSIEVVQGTNFADVLVGDGNANIFIGGAGADAIDGGAGVDGAWYLNSASAVQINLLAGTSAGGDAADDMLSNIENLIGTSFDDTVTGNALDNKLEGSYGNDIINGGDGADLIYGGVGSDVGILAATNTAAQADMLYGGNGNDIIVTKGSDAGSFAFGESGNDTIIVENGTADGGVGTDVITVTGGGKAYGGDGVDTFTASGVLYTLFGDAGADVFNLNGTGGGGVNGGEDGDIYNVNTTGIVYVKDTGAAGNDILYLNNIATVADVVQTRIGDDLYITSQADINDNGMGDSGVVLLGWYAGGNTVEFLVTADHLSYPL